MAQDMHSILSLDDKGLSTARNACSKLFRHILLSLNVERMIWDRKMREWLENPKSGTANTKAKRSSNRSNLNRTLSKDAITWRKFREAIGILNPKRVYYTLDIVWVDGIVLPGEMPTHVEFEQYNRENELCRIIRRLMTDCGITPVPWNILVERYLDRMFEDHPNNPVDYSTERGNINKVILNKDTYTWENFVLALTIMGVKEVTFTVILEWGKTRSSEHAHTFKTGL